MKREISNLQHRTVRIEQLGNWWIAAILSFVISLTACFLFIATRPASPDPPGLIPDLTNLFFALVSLSVGALVCVGFAIVSFVRRERNCMWAILPAVPSAVLLLWELSFLAQKQSERSRDAAEGKVYLSYLDQLKADPEIALREHWPSNRATEQSRAFFDAVWAPHVEYSASQVERIYAEMPEFRGAVFNQVSCTPEFIRAHLDEAFDLARKKSPGMLEKMIHNRHTPIDLLQRVIFYRKQLPFEPPYQAGLVLFLRHADVPLDPREILRPYARDADGKFFVLTLRGLNTRLPDGGGGKNRLSDDVNSYVPGVPPDFDLSHLGADELVFLPGLYDESSDVKNEQLRLAEEFALEHNQRVLQQRTAK